MPETYAPLPPAEPPPPAPHSSMSRGTLAALDGGATISTYEGLGGGGREYHEHKGHRSAGTADTHTSPMQTDGSTQLWDEHEKYVGVTDGVIEADAVTDGVGENKGVTDGVDETETVTGGVGENEGVTDGVGETETVTDGVGESAGMMLQPLNWNDATDPCAAEYDKTLPPLASSSSMSIACGRVVVVHTHASPPYERTSMPTTAAVEPHEPCSHGDESPG